MTHYPSHVHNCWPSRVHVQNWWPLKSSRQNGCLPHLKSSSSSSFDTIMKTAWLHWYMLSCDKTYLYTQLKAASNYVFIEILRGEVTLEIPRDRKRRWHVQHRDITEFIFMRFTKILAHGTSRDLKLFGTSGHEQRFIPFRMVPCQSDDSKETINISDLTIPKLTPKLLRLSTAATDKHGCTLAPI